MYVAELVGFRLDGFKLGLTGSGFEQTRILNPNRQDDENDWLERIEQGENDVANRRLTECHKTG